MYFYFQEIRMKRLSYVILLALYGNLGFYTHAKQKYKIVAYMQVRNEENIIEQALRCLSYYVDAMVILDDASTDTTPAILERLRHELPIERIIYNETSAWLTGGESDSMQKLLQNARDIGGTHFIFMDADEIISSNCLDKDYLRKQILSLERGDVIALKFVNLWRSTNFYRCDGSPYGRDGWRAIIFHDYPGCSYKKSSLHGSRHPHPLSGKLHKLPRKYAVLHFQFVNWENLLAKQAWYRCLEHVKKIQEPNAINRRYDPSKDERALRLEKTSPDWLEGYKDFDTSLYDLPVKWRKQQVREWFEQFGEDYFKPLHIWDVNWYEDV